MKKYELPIEQQIQILTDAKELLTKNSNTAYISGVCGSVYKALKKSSIVDDHMSYGYEKHYITGFNLTNAKRLSKKYHFSIPDGIRDGWWWNSSDGWNMPRLAFINALITELKLSLNK